MKTNRIVQFVLAIFISINFISCGNDDNEELLIEDDLVSEIKMTFNEKEILFDVFEITEYEEFGMEYQSISATSSSEILNSLSITIVKNEDGTSSFDYFLFFDEGIRYVDFRNTLNYNIDVRTSSKLKASFSGKLKEFDDENSELSTFEGLININY